MLDKNVILDKKVIFVTGAAGFIGSNLVLNLFRTIHGSTIIGLDNMNDYYDVSLKNYRLKQIEAESASQKNGNNWIFVQGDLQDKQIVERTFMVHKPHIVVNLAAQAGVRYSISHPGTYIESNIIGFFNILEACRHYPVQHLVYASSSSVYGMNSKIPYNTEDKTDQPVSLYAATKKCNELLAHAYSKLYGIPCTGLRFFTVYGPAGRPDMAYFSFTNKLRHGEKIQIFNYGKCRRDFTYVDDIVESVHRIIESAPEVRNGENGLPLPSCKVYNIGNSHPENLLEFVRILKEELILSGVLSPDYDFDGHMELVPMQPGDVEETYADTTALEQDFGVKPHTSLRDGLRAFAQWYKSFYKD